MAKELHPDWVTVGDVYRAIGIVCAPPASWEVGAEVRRLWLLENDDVYRPLRPKAAERGSHCLAAYPPSWAGRIEEVIRAHNPTTDPQDKLF